MVVAAGQVSMMNTDFLLYEKSLDLSPAQRNALYDMYQEWGFIPSLPLKIIGKKGY